MKKISLIMKSILATIIFSTVTSTYNVQASTLAARTSNKPFEIVSDMGVGWNLGDTFDSYTYDELWFDGSNPKEWEKSWGNVETTKEMIDKIKEAGFNTIRIPITWGPHMGQAPDYKIDDAWMNRIAEVVDYCMADDIYTIINVHHDEKWCIPNYENEEESIDKLTKLWTQLAVRFKDYDHNLIFEAINEPRELYPNNSDLEWKGTTESHDVVNKLNNAALNTIRVTGSNNAERTVIVPTYAASSTDEAINDFVVPEDDHIIVSIHAYSPAIFAQSTEDEIPGMKENLHGIIPDEYIEMIDWHALLCKWDTESNKKEITDAFDKFYNKFVSKGVPVVLGEFGAVNKNNTEDRAKHSAFYVSEAKKRGMACILWDNGKENFGFFDRQNLNWFYPEIRNAIINAYNSTEKLD